MNVLRVTASMDPTVGGPPQGIRNSIVELERLGIRSEAVCCDAPDAAWLGKDSFPVHALGPGKYGYAYTPKLGPWLEENLPRFDAVIVHGLWLWPSMCATRAVARERARRKEQKTSHSRVCETAEGKLTRIDEDKSERLAADRTKGIADCRMTSTAGGVSTETLNSKQLRCFVMPHGMLDPWFQRDKSRRVKAVRNWFYWWLVERGVVNSADALLFTCQQELELARTPFGGYLPKREINVGYGIAEPPTFEPKMQEAFAARCPGLQGRAYLLFMSRVHPKKGVDLLVRAYARVRREHVEKTFSHSRVCETAEGKLTRIDEDRSERLAADRTGGECLVPGIAYGPSTAGEPPVPAVDGLSTAARTERDSLPDLVIAGPGWDSDYGKRIKELIREQGAGGREWGGSIHAVDMLQGDAKWGGVYGCEAFVLPSHQENFGIAVVEALACGKPVLISDQVNIWPEIVEDGAGLVGEDTEEGVEKLLRKFFGRPVTSEELRVASGSAFAPSDSGVTMGGPRECYLKRFAIGPAAASLARALKED